MEAVFDPGFIYGLFRKTLDPDCPEAHNVLDSLERCTQPVAYCPCGCGNPYFVDPEGPGWKFLTNLSVWCDRTLYVLDVMEDWTVGGIEILKDFPMPLEDMQVVEVD